MVTVGSLAPSFTVLSSTGQMCSLADLKGRWMILYFYPKDDTPGCTLEACGFRDAFQQLSQVATILGVSQDSLESHEQFIAKYRLPFELLIDADGALRAAYGAVEGALGKRVTFLIDPRGVVQKVYQGIDCAQHAGQILRDLQDLRSKA